MKTFKYLLISLVLLLAATVNAEELSYLNENGELTKLTSATISVTSSLTSWSDGWYVVDENVTISDRIQVSGTVNLLLKNGVTLTAEKGINVGSDASFNVYAQSDKESEMGALNATGESKAAGIGCGNSGSVGIITINGGLITATGIRGGAGIGSGYGVSGATIVINGGIISATGESGAGIGGGYEGGGGTITINGGTVTATGGNGGAGIGGGYEGGGGTITIDGGTVTATGGSSGAGIGGGNKGSGGTITINGGTVTATGGNGGAGIGGGNKGAGGTIIIDGGTVTAMGGSYGAGIGGGNGGFGEIITINGGKVTANAGKNASGFGSGYRVSGGEVILGWTNEDDFVYANNYDGAETIKFADGKQFYYEENGKKTVVESMDNIGGKTLYPLSDGKNSLKYANISGIQSRYSYTGEEIVLTYKVIDFEGKELVAATDYTAAFTPSPVKDAGDYTLTIEAKKDGTYTGKKTISFSVYDGTVAATTTEMTNGIYRVSSDVTVDERIVITGDVTLILDEGKTLTASKGIDVSNENKLTIVGKGALDAIGEKNAAGIGGGDGKKGGVIAINGGIVTAKGVGSGAGIGGGDGKEGGTITIDGGNVTAKGGNYGAGIGGGGHGSGGIITIIDGTISATGGPYGAGIGGGYSGAGGTIAIIGGKVTANSGRYSVGIGQGTSGPESGSVMLDWTNEDDFIYADSYGSVKSIKFANGKQFYYEDNGEITVVERTDNIGGKTLRPIYNKNSLKYAFVSGLQPSYYYTGNEMVLTYKVTDIEGKELAAEIDYMATFIPSSVKDAGDYTLTIAAKKDGAYTDSKSVNFAVVKRSLENSTISGLQPSYYYTGNEIVLSYKVSDSEGKELVAETDYTATVTPSPVKDEGDYTLTITAKDDAVYTGKKTISFTVVDEKIPVTATTMEMTNRIYKVSSDVTIDERIVITGDVTLILDEGKTLTASKGVEVSSGNKLTIEGMGSLYATGKSYTAGIGGGNGKEGGIITINGGSVSATGGSYGAGVGGGNNGAGGTVVINGGSVTVTGGVGGAGIGGGDGGFGGTVSVNGGTVTAMGGSSAAGVGGGNNGAGGTVSINGGKVTVNGGSNSVGIGPGRRGPANGSVTLGWTDEDDFIYASSYGDVETIKFADDKQFYYEENGGITVVEGTVNIGGKTLRPIYNKNSLKYAFVSGIQPSYYYTGEEIILTYNVTDIEGKELVAETDYTATFTPSPVKDAGDYMLTIAAKDDGKYAGSKNVNFAVVKRSLENATISGVQPIYYYTGEEIALTYKVTDSEGKELVEGTDYTVTFTPFPVKEEGDYTLTIAAKDGGIYTGSKSVNFAVVKQSLEDATISGVKPSYYYTGEEIALTYKVTDVEGKELVENADYTATITPSSVKDEGDYTLTIKAKDGGIYAGSKSVNFAVVKQSLENATISGVKPYYLYTGEEIALTYKVTDIEGKELVENTDYTVSMDKSPIKDKGGYMLTIAAIDDGVYTGSKTVSFTVVEGITVTATTTEMTNGIYRVLSDVTVDERIVVTGDVTLLLDEGKTLTASKGIDVSSGNKLTIDGKGSLNAMGDSDAAGIGGGKGKAGGTIIISGGTITATGGYHAAGIGGGYYGSGGIITINGGTVTAMGDGGVGIGGGYGKDGGTISINGGKVTANGGSNSVGIGGGFYGSGGTITINGGTVTATGDYGGVGIGGGYGKDCGTISINGGKVTANGGSNSVGIGPGHNGFGGNITLGWTNEDDFIYANSYGGVETIKFADGKSFYYEESGKNVIVENADNIGGKTLRPLFYGKNSLKYAFVSGIQPSYAYTGEEISLTYKVTDVEENKLVAETDFTATFTPSPVKDAGDYTLTITAKDGSLYTGSKTVSFSVIPPYIISNEKDWDDFVASVNNGETYSGKFIKLNDNISVSTKVGVRNGSQDRAFSGVFDGGGHTITANITDNNNPGTALFGYISGATIKNLTVAGKITGGIHAAGIVGFSAGTGNRIDSCVVSATIDGGTHIGGILGHGLSSDIAIENCIFKGKLVGGETAKGVLFGWGDEGGTKTVTNSLYIQQDGQNMNHLDLAKMDAGSVTMKNSYKAYLTAPVDDIITEKTAFDGTKCYIVAASISGIQPYYSYTGEEIALTYKVTDIEGKALIENTDYTASLDKYPIKDEGKYTFTITVKEGGAYTGKKTISFTVFDGIPVTATTTAMTSGRYGVLSDVTIDERIVITGDVTLILDEGKTLTASKGIKLSSGNKLTIDGKGTLNANGESENSGIGDYEVGSLIVEDGIVNAKGGDKAAGIGGSINNREGGDITIKGGIVNATGGQDASGIGGGYRSWRGPYGLCGTINIIGGKVTAKGGSNSVGVGPGNSGPASGSVTLGWTDEDDIIYASSYGDVESIKFVDGKSFYYYEESGKGVVVENPDNIGGKTLYPFDGNIVPTYSVTLPKQMILHSASNIADKSGKYFRSGTVVSFRAKSFWTASNVSDGKNTLTPTDGIYSVTVGDADIVIDGEFTRNNNVDLVDIDDGFSAIDGDIMTGTTSYTVQIFSGASVTLNDATINGGIECDADAIITLVGSNRVTGVGGQAGIKVGLLGKTLTIKGNGSLEAIGGTSAAGIGCSFKAYNIDNLTVVNCGNVVIEGGCITAKGGVDAAGIGMSRVSSQSGIYYMVGDITIKGGVVNAIAGTSWSSGSGASGIGLGNVPDQILNSEKKMISVGKVSIYDDIEKVDASSISETVTYMHGETDVSANKNAYFNIVADGEKQTITPKNEPDYAITIDKNMKGGLVICRNTARVGDKVILNPVPARGYTFNSLSVKDEQGNDISGNNSSSTGAYGVIISVAGDDETEKEYSFMMPAQNVIVSAEFVSIYGIVFDENIKNGSVTADVVAPGSGDVVTLTATPDEGYVLAAFSVKDEQGNVINVNGNTFVMPASNVIVSATFSPGYKVVMYEKIENGKVIVDKTTVIAGDVVTLTAVPDEGYAFAEYSVREEHGKSINVNNNMFVMPANNVIVYAAFGLTYNIVIDGSMENGSVTTNKTVAMHGERVALTATPASGYSLLFYTVKDAAGNNVEVKNDTFTMPKGDVTVSAVFSKGRIVYLDTLKNDYTVKDGDILAGETNHTISANDNDVTFTLYHATINGGIKTTLNTTIILEDSNYVVGSYREAGIGLGLFGKTLTIKGNGKLNAFGGNAMPGIGVGRPPMNAAGTITQDKWGNLVIESGTVTATGDDAAGIGVGGSSGVVYVGYISFNGGTVEANGGNYSAGIGTGRTTSKGVKIMGLVFNGGTVIANGGDNADADIGVGDDSRTKLIIDSIAFYHGFKEVSGNIKKKSAEKIVYKNGENDVSGNAEEYFAITSNDSKFISKVRSLFNIGIDNNIAHGTIAATVASSNGKAYADEVVTLSATPKSGYKVDFYTVKDAAGNNIEVNNSSFVMPLGDVTVSAKFVSDHPLITFSEDGKKMTIEGEYDGKDIFNIDKDITVDEVVFNREFTPNSGFATIMLPFDINATKLTGVKSIIEFAGVFDNKGKNAVGMKYVWCNKDLGKEVEDKGYTNCNELSGDLTAYTPYMVEMETPTLGINGNVTLKPNSGKIVGDARKDDWVFRGALQKKEWSGDENIIKNGRIWAFAGSERNGATIGQFRRIGGNTSVKPFRAYLVDCAGVPEGSDCEEYFENQSEPSYVSRYRFADELAPATPAENSLSAEKQAGTATNQPLVMRVSAANETASLNGMEIVIVDGDKDSIGGNEHTTVIGRVNPATGEIHMRPRTKQTYDLKGRKVGKGKKAKGAYYRK